MKDEPAFPTTELSQHNPGVVVQQCFGLTKREYIAAQLMAALLSQESLRVGTLGEHAHCAVDCADALIQELEKAHG